MEAYRVCGAVSTETPFRIGTDKYSVKLSCEIGQELPVEII